MNHMTTSRHGPDALAHCPPAVARRGRGPSFVVAVFILMLGLGLSWGGPPNPTEWVAVPQPQVLSRPLVFEPNRGQAPPHVTWLARGPGYELFLTGEGVTLLVPEGTAEPLGGTRRLSPRHLGEPKAASATRKASMVGLKLEGSQPWTEVTGLEPTGGVSNYLAGSDAKDSYTHIPHFARVKVSSVYRGVDLVFYGNGGDLEYDFVVQPGADPTQIQMAFEGTGQLHVDDQSGDLLLTVGDGSALRQVRPKVYQDVDSQRVPIAGGYQVLDHRRAAFTLAAYDRSRPLVIDPIVVFTSFFGGSAADKALAVAVDSDGNSYVTGGTQSRDFPVSDGSAWQSCDHPLGGFCGPIQNIFVRKLSPTGTILFSTYAGPGEGNGIAVDATGVYVTGWAKNPEGPIEVADAGEQDLFIWKLSLTGDLLYTAYYGGSEDDIGYAIAVDSEHNAWVAGATRSPEFTTGGPDIYSMLVLKLNPSGGLVFRGTARSTGDTVARAVAIDPADQPWFTGSTCGDGFPTFYGVVYPGAGCRVFVRQLSRTGTGQESMVFGGSDDGDAGTAIVPNGNHSAYVTGYTHSAHFPTTADAFQTVRTSGGPQAFVTQVASFSQIVHSTLLGADGDTYGYAIVSDDGRAVYVAGGTSSSHFPGAPALVPNPTAGFVSKFSQNLTQLRYTKLLGANVYGIDLRKPAATPRVPEIFAVGARYTGVPEIVNLDPFVVKMVDDITP
jgi:hypothetical protein